MYKISLNHYFFFAKSETQKILTNVFGEIIYKWQWMNVIELHYFSFFTFY